MKSLLAVLALSSVVGYFWCRTPAVIVGYAPLPPGVMFGLESNWCRPPDEHYIWELLPKEAAYVSREWWSDWPDFDSLPGLSTAEYRQQLNAAKWIWLGMTALQVALLGLLLRRHRQLAGNVRSLAAWLRSHPAKIGLVLLIVVSAILMVGISSYLLGWQMDSFCHTQMGSGNLSFVSTQADPALLATRKPYFVQLHGAFDIVAWTSLVSCFLLMIVSYVPLSRMTFPDR